MTYLRRIVTLSDLGRPRFQPPVCDFCGLHAPMYIYGAERTLMGYEKRCWRWAACPGCAEDVEAENWSAITMRIAETLRRNSLGRVPPRQLRTIVETVLGDFHRWAIKNVAPPETPESK